MKTTHHESGETMREEVREMFIGHHTIWALIGLAVGGTLVAKTLWEWFSTWFGMVSTLLIGFCVFVVSGLSLHAFHESQTPEEEELLEEVVEA